MTSSKDNQSEEAVSLRDTTGSLQIDALQMSSMQSAQALRQRAEKFLLDKTAQTAVDLEPVSLEEIRRILHELQVYQIELEMQNEELLRTQAELEASKAYYFDFYDLAPVGYATLSEKGLILKTNLAAAIFLGVARGELVKQPMSQFIRKEDQDLYYLHCKKVIATGELQVCDLQMVRKDESAFWMRLYSIAAHDSDGAPVCRVVLNDITEQKRAEMELWQSKERFRKVLLDVQSVAVQGYKPDGTTQYWNCASEQLYGYSAQEAIGRNLRDLIIPPEMRGEVEQAMRQMAETKQPIPAAELSLMRKDGSRVAVFSSHTIVQVPGLEPELFCIDIDISKRKQAEEEQGKLQTQLIQAQKMESVGRLAGGVAHDFNNMLGVIIGYTQLAIEATEPNSSLHHDMLQVLEAAQRSANITRQLLAFARKQPVSPKTLNLNEIIEQGMLQMLRRLIGENIDLAWKPKTNLWKVKIDASQLDQLLVNLCVNARDAINGVGKITVETGKVLLDALFCTNHLGATPGEHVVLRVKDDGGGMDPEVLNNIFEPFFTTKAFGQGTGLGLATVYGIVKQNKGFIDVMSTPSLGTTFSIYLPRYREQADQAPLEISTESVGGRGHETILLVEDEQMILDLATIMLQSQGYTVLATTTPGEALELADQHAGEIHILVTDVIMPGMNGRELADRLHSLYPDIKLLFMSGYTADIIAAQGVMDESSNFIQKPFASKDFITKVAKILTSELTLQHKQIEN